MGAVDARDRPLTDLAQRRTSDVRNRTTPSLNQDQSGSGTRSLYVRCSELLGRTGFDRARSGKAGSRNSRRRNRRNSDVVVTVGAQEVSQGGDVELMAANANQCRNGGISELVLGFSSAPCAEQSPRRARTSGAGDQVLAPRSHFPALGENTPGSPEIPVVA